MIFPYKKIGPSKYGPVVPLRLKGIRDWFIFNAFVDSGADYSVFDASVASLIGLAMKSGIEKGLMVGDGDKMTVYVHIVPVRFAGFLFKAPIAFSSELGSGFNLMGRATFFERFRICFNDCQRVVTTSRLY